MAAPATFSNEFPQRFDGWGKAGPGKKVQMATSTAPIAPVAEPLRDVAEAYDADPERLAGYAALMALYGVGITAFGLALRRSGRRLPATIPPGDVALLGVATFKLSRLLSRSSVAGVVRAPFTRRKGRLKGPEVQDAPRGGGMRRSVGELLTCPFCVAQWIGTALAGAYVVAPDATRMASATLSAVAVADVLQYAHAALQDAVD